MISMKKVVLFLFFTSLFFSCKKEEVVPTDDNELITTVELIFTDANKKASTFSFQDKDGDGKTPPEKFDKIVLDKNMAYTMEVHMYDETKNPKLDITEEIESESDEDFNTRMLSLTEQLSEQLAESRRLEGLISKQLKGLGYEL